MPQRTFHYYHPETRGLDFASMMDDIKVKESFFVFQNGVFIFSLCQKNQFFCK